MKYLVLFILLSCTEKEPQPQSSPNFLEEISQVKGLWSQYRQDRPPSIIVLADNSVESGSCESNSKLIFINLDVWHGVSPKRRLVLLLHEVGHCFLGRDHNEQFLSHRAISIMMPMLPSESSYELYADEYHKELFNNNSQTIRQALNRGEI